MNYNIIGYFVFLSVIAFIIVKVGKICYVNGNKFVAELLPNHTDLCIQLNRILLVAYYLVNIGYSAMTLIQWQKIDSLEMLVETLAIKSALIISILAVLHYLNIFVITNYIQKIIKH